MRVALVIATLFLLAAAGFAQRFGGLRFEGHDEGADPVFPSKGEFHFIRMEYTDLPNGIGAVRRERQNSLGPTIADQRVRRRAARSCAMSAQLHDRGDRRAGPGAERVVREG